MKWSCKKNIIVFLFLFVFLPAFGQDYQAFKPDWEYYFKGVSTGNINAVVLDSTRNFSDTVCLYNFFNLRNPVDSSVHCYNPFGASWIGLNMIITQNGDHFFFNRYGDTILLKSKSSLSDRWVMFRYPDGHYVEAKITSIDTFSFLGLTDTVKVITLMGKDQNGNDLESALNNKQILLSKKYGLIQGLDFYFFPGYQTDDPGFLINPDTVYCLAGITQLAQGIKNITARDVFEFNIGDEFHTEYIHTPVGPYTRTKEYLIKKVIDKVVSNNKDTVRYGVAVCGRKEVTETNGNTQVSLENDTVVEMHIFSEEDRQGLGYLPGESFYKSEAGHYEYMNMSVSGDYNGRLIKSFPPVAYLLQDEDCYRMCLTTPGQPYRYYIKGCGGEYYVGNYDKEWGDHYQLVYFKKGDETWGTPFECDGLLNKNKPVTPDTWKYTVFPNPADHSFIVRFENEIMHPCDFILFDASGRKVKEVKITGRETKISVEDLCGGFYFYEVRSSDRSVRTAGKIVIK